MKTCFRILITLCLLGGLSWLALAQDDAAVRDIVKSYQSGHSSGVRVAVMLHQETGLTNVDPAQEFKTGDRLKVALETNFTGYVYVVNYGSSGAKRLLFPGLNESNRLQPGRQYYLPTSYDLRLDGPSGIEALKVFFSLNRVAFLDAASRREDGELNAGEVAQIEKLWGQGDAQKPGLAAESVKLKATRSAESRDPVWDARHKTSYVVLRQKKGQSGKLMKNKIVAFIFRA